MEAFRVSPPGNWKNAEEGIIFLGIVSFASIFSYLVALFVTNKFDMFTRRHARRHRVAGLLYVLWLVVGFLSLFTPVKVNALLHHIVLGILGVTVTLTAAFDFKFHERVKNKGSGTLEKETTVTFSEMIEHSFYQGLNLLQIVYIHTAPSTEPLQRAILFGAITAPWLVRNKFPVNSFSKNYKEIALKDYSVEILLYRIKKYQYVFYKHVLLHGLNLTMAVHPVPLAQRPLFLLYWLSLNASYVFEFFFQTLVKKGFISQDHMLMLQKILMLVSSIGALSVLFFVRWDLALGSFILNMLNRGHDFANSCLLLSIAILIQ